VRGAFAESAHACVIALPPAEMAALAPNLTQAQRGFLNAITLLPSVNVHLGLRHHQKQRRPVSQDARLCGRYKSA